MSWIGENLHILCWKLYILLCFVGRITKRKIIITVIHIHAIYKIPLPGFGVTEYKTHHQCEGSTKDTPPLQWYMFNTWLSSKAHRDVQSQFMAYFVFYTKIPTLEIVGTFDSILSLLYLVISSHLDRCNRKLYHWEFILARFSHLLKVFKTIWPNMKPFSVCRLTPNF